MDGVNLARQHGKWSQSGVPHSGWTCEGTDDLGAPTGTCEMCETHQIRFVHRMVHPAYQGSLDCGCICAGNMAEDVPAAKARETALRRAGGQRKRAEARQEAAKLKATQRLAQQVSDGWLRSRQGNPYRNEHGCNVTVFAIDGGGWGARVLHRDTGRQVRSPHPFATELEAKQAALMALNFVRGHLAATQA